MVIIRPLFFGKPCYTVFFIPLAKTWVWECEFDKVASCKTVNIVNCLIILIYKDTSFLGKTMWKRSIFHNLIALNISPFFILACLEIMSPKKCISLKLISSTWSLDTGIIWLLVKILYTTRPMNGSLWCTYSWRLPRTRSTLYIFQY